MARYVAALANGGSFEGTNIVASGAGVPSGRAYSTDWQPLAAGGADVLVGQSGSTLTSNADILVQPGGRLGVVVLLNANPTQLLGLAAGAADIALDVMRLAAGLGPGSTAPPVRSVYLVVDAVLLILVVAFAVHASRARTWRRRLATTDHRGWLVGRTVVADLVLPVAVLLAVPLWIGSTGSSPGGDVPAGWSFLLWTLPDVAATVLLLALGALALGTFKLAAVSVEPSRHAEAPSQPMPHA